MKFKCIFLTICIVALSSCSDSLDSRKNSELLNIHNGSLEITDTDLVEFGVGWVPILLDSVKKLESEELSEKKILKECYQIILDRDDKGFNSVSFLSVQNEIYSESHADNRTNSSQGNIDKCGPAVTYLYNDDGVFIAKHYMRH